MQAIKKTTARRIEQEDEMEYQAEWWRRAKDDDAEFLRLLEKHHPEEKFKPPVDTTTEFPKRIVYTYPTRQTGYVWDDMDKF